MTFEQSARRVRADLTRCAHASAFELLEPRRLLAGSNAFDLSSIPIYHATSSDIADVQNGPMAIAGSSLINLYREYRRAAKANREFVNTDRVLDIRDGDKVGVTLRIRTNDLERFVRGLRNAYDFDVSATNPQFNVVQGYLPINWLRTLATRADVAQLWPIAKAQTRQQGEADNQADLAENAQQARTDLVLDGKGVKVGVLSDSFGDVGGGYSDSVATGDLPAGVDVVEEGFGADEGRAMLELIHDIAPGAGLAFATAGGGQQAFANNIKKLKDAGSSVIVDDIGYLDEPFFQEGVIDSAMREVVKGGAVYLTAAGNGGNSGYEDRARFTTVGGVTLIDFDPGFARDTRLTINLATLSTIALQWDEPYNGVTGSANTNLDIRFYQGGGLKGSGTDDNIKTGRPLEFVTLEPGLYEVEIRVKELKAGTSLPTRFRFLTFDEGITSTEYAQNRASAIGHSASDAGISVGAVPFWSAPPFSTVTPIRNETFSAVGGATYTRDANGKRLPFPLVPQSPKVSGIDDVNTSFFGFDSDQDTDRLPNFQGTSAAAPNVAAIIAMIKQADPNATQAQIVSALETTSRALNDSNQGEWDKVGGFGLVDASALVPIFIGPPSVTVSRVFPDPTGEPISSIKFKFNQVVNGFNLADLKLTRDGAKTNLLTSFQFLTTTDRITWTLNNLAGLTTTPGVYKINLNPNSSGITNVVDAVLTTGAHDVWTKIPKPPRPNKVTNFTAIATSSSSIQLNWDDTNTTEYDYYLQQSTTSNFTSGTRSVHLQPDTESFLATGLKPGTRYYFRVRAVNTTRPGTFSDGVPALTLLSGEAVIDNVSAQTRVSGSWASTTSGNDFIGTNYLTDGNTGKGSKIVRYDLPIRSTGNYYVYGHWTNGSDRATNTPFDIFYGTGATARQTIKVNQRTRGGQGWTPIGGPFLFQRNSAAAVRIRNAGTNGVVVADAIRILPAGPLPSGRSTQGLTRGPSFPGFAQGDSDNRNAWDDSLL